MAKLHKLPKDALVVVCDSRKALFLRNAGTPMSPKLVTERHVDAPSNPANREQQADRPGRMPDQKAGGTSGGPKSAMEQTDWHARNEERFAGDVAALLEKMHRKEMLESIVIAAPPGFMGAFRKALADPVNATTAAGRETVAAVG